MELADDDFILIAGGDGLSTADIYSRSREACYQTKEDLGGSDMSDNRMYFNVVLLEDGTILLIGGTTSSAGDRISTDRIDIFYPPIQEDFPN